MSQPKGPEPILTCVQCLADYKESENAGTHTVCCGQLARQGVHDANLLDVHQLIE